MIFYPSRIPGSKWHRLPDPDPQHCRYVVDTMTRIIIWGTKCVFKAWWRAETNSAAYKLTHWPPGGRISCTPSPRGPPRACSRCDGARRWCTCCCSRRTGTPSHPAHDTCGTPQPPALHTHTRTNVRRRGSNKDDVIYRTGDEVPQNVFGFRKISWLFWCFSFSTKVPRKILAKKLCII